MKHDHKIGAAQLLRKLVQRWLRGDGKPDDDIEHIHRAFTVAHALGRAEMAQEVREAAEDVRGNLDLGDDWEGDSGDLLDVVDKALSDLTALLVRLPGGS